MLATSLFSLLLLFSGPDTSGLRGQLQLTVENVKTSGGRIWVGIYGSEEEFLDRDKARLVEAKVDREGEVQLLIPDLEYGLEYALAIFHDEDDNGELDRNFFGLPAEPWAFSGEPKTRLRLPYFSEVKFCFKEGMKEQTVRLRMW